MDPNFLCIINIALKKALTCKIEFWGLRGRREIRMSNMPEANPGPDVGGKLYYPKPILSPTVLVTLLEAGLNFRTGVGGNAEQDRYKPFVPHHPFYASSKYSRVSHHVLPILPALWQKKEIKQNIEMFFSRNVKPVNLMACQLRKTYLWFCLLFGPKSV